MRYLRNLLVMVIAVTAFSFVTVNAQSQNISQNAIEQKVFKEIHKLPRYGLFDHIAFRVDGGTVTLFGKTNSLGTRKGAEKAVKRVPGVVEVINNIEELPPSSFDNRIRREIVREFWNSSGVYPYISGLRPSVRIIVENGRVTLEGYVPNRGTSNLMYMLANRVPGTFEVTNHLIVGKDS